MKYEELNTKFEEQKNTLIETNKNDNEKLQKDLKEEKEKNEKLNKELNDQKNKLEQKEKSYQDILQNEKNIYTQLQNNYDQLLSKDVTSKKEIKNLNQKNSELSNELQKEQEKSAHLNNQLIKLSNNIKGITDFDNLQKEIEDDYKKSKDVLEDKNNNEDNIIISKLKEKIKGCLVFEKLYNEEKIKYNDLDTKYKNQSNEITDLKNQIKNLEMNATNNKNTKEELMNKNNEIIKLNEQINVKNNEIKDKEDKIKEINEENQKKISDLEKIIQENKNQILKEKQNSESTKKELEKNICQIKESLKDGSINIGMSEEFKELYKFIDNHFNGLSKSLIHEGIKCEKCFDEPIIGYRYKCTICNDYNLCEKCEEKNLDSEEHPHYFIKIGKEYKEGDEITYNIPDIINNNLNNNNNNINNINEIKNDDNNNDNNIIVAKKEYSYECLNKNKLSSYIYEGTDEAKIEIILKNNGKEDWPKDCAKLIFDRASNIEGEDIVLEPQKSGEQKIYHAIFKKVSKYRVGEYKSFLLFSVNDETFGEELELTVEIKENEENIDRINEFRQKYDLNNNDYSNEKILEALKKNNFDYDKAFSSLFD